MIDLIAISFCFFLAVVCHLVYCRWSADKTLKVLQFFFLAAVFFIGSRLLAHSLAPLFPVDSFWRWKLPLTSEVFYVLLIPFYLNFYASEIIDSLSRSAMMVIRDEEGITFVDLVKRLADRSFVMARFEELLAQGIIEENNGGYRLSKRGVVCCQVFKFYELMFGKMRKDRL